METAASILIVDDDVDIRASVSDILTDCGYCVDVAEDGASALQLVAERPYDIALLDFVMPGIDGAELYRRIRKIQPSIVAIMITAYDEPNGLQRARDAGAWRVLQKPVDLAQVLKLINETLQQPFVLLVDDDADFCDALWDVLRERGFRVDVAHEPQRAESLIRSHEFDILLLDLRLGQASGELVFQQLADRSHRTRTVIVTGETDTSKPTIDRLLALGAHAVCFKPIQVQELIRLLNF